MCKKMSIMLIFMLIGSFAYADSISWSGVLTKISDDRVLEVLVNSDYCLDSSEEGTLVLMLQDVLAPPNPNEDVLVRKIKKGRGSMKLTHKYKVPDAVDVVTVYTAIIPGKKNSSVTHVKKVVIDKQDSKLITSIYDDSKLDYHEIIVDTNKPILPLLSTLKNVPNGYINPSFDLRKNGRIKFKTNFPESKGSSLWTGEMISLDDNTLEFNLSFEGGKTDLVAYICANSFAQGKSKVHIWVDWKNPKAEMNYNRRFNTSCDMILAALKEKAEDEKIK